VRLSKEAKLLVSLRSVIVIGDSKILVGSQRGCVRREKVRKMK
jgi:hypothetical protein